MRAATGGRQAEEAGGRWRPEKAAGLRTEGHACTTFCTPFRVLMPVSMRGLAAGAQPQPFHPYSLLP